MEIQALIERPSGRAIKLGSRTPLYRALRDAALVHGLADAVTRTAERLIDFIPADATEPISPVQVQRLADARGCDPRTIRNHVARLLALGLCADRRRDGGGRSVVRDGSGRLVAAFGVSFAPLAAQAEALAAKAAEIEARAVEKARLRGEISAMRRRIRVFVGRLDPASPLAAAFTVLPPRIAHLELGELAALWGRVADLELAVRDSLEEARVALAPPVSGSGDGADRSENSVRQSYITTETNDIFRNRSPIKTAEDSKQRSAARPDRRPNANAGLEHIQLSMALDAAPPDWKADLDRRGASWSALVEVAHERCRLLGVSPDAWMGAVAALGRNGAAVLILLADAGHIDRGGDIRRPGGWVRRITERAERGEAQLHRSMFGILARQGRMR